MTVPFPPAEEQAAIVCEVERQLALIKSLDAGLSKEQRRVTTLRSSVLAAAFSGKLAPQDRDDEPASMLLEHIRASRVLSDNNKAAHARKPTTSRPDANGKVLTERRTGIQLMWEDGYPIREIADTMEMTATQVGNEMRRMRKDGWDLPYRRRKATA